MIWDGLDRSDIYASLIRTETRATLIHRTEIAIIFAAISLLSFFIHWHHL